MNGMCVGGFFVCVYVHVCLEGMVQQQGLTAACSRWSWLLCGCCDGVVWFLICGGNATHS